MKRTRASVPALIRALGFIAARQLEARLPKPKPKSSQPGKELHAANVEELPIVRAPLPAPKLRRYR